MAWFKVDDSSTFHPKVMAVGNEAWGAFVRLGAWASQQLTDGFVPTSMIQTIMSSQVLDQLTAIGLLEPSIGGYQIHDYEDYNPPADEVKRKREEAKLRMRGLREQRGDTLEQEACSREVREKFGNPVPVPVPRDINSPLPPKDETPAKDDGFDLFWAGYPKKDAKPEAQKAWKQIGGGVDIAELIRKDVSRRLAAKEWELTKDRKRFIPNPATYLRARRWEDEVVDDGGWDTAKLKQMTPTELSRHFGAY